MSRTDESKPSQPKPMVIPPGMRECEYALRFGPARIRAGETLDVKVVCADQFYPRRLLISPDVAKNFVVDDLTVGGNHMMSPGIAQAWFADAEGMGWLGMDPIGPGQAVVMRVTNPGTSDARFECCLMGKGVVKIRERGTAPTYLDRARTPRFSRGRK